VKHAHPHCDMTATDASADALAVARSNGERLGLQVDWRAGDWWSAVTDAAPFHLVLSNPPYIADGDVHLAALGHEPAMALTSGADGLDAIRAIVAGARQHLAPGAWLLLEHGHDQADACAALLHRAGFDSVQSRRDLAGVWRCTGGHVAS
jgi:release factor glutamine methyltransferase